MDQAMISDLRCTQNRQRRTGSSSPSIPISISVDISISISVDISISIHIHIHIHIHIRHGPDEPITRVLAVHWLNAVSLYRAWISHQNDDPSHCCTSHEQRKHTSARKFLCRWAGCTTWLHNASKSRTAHFAELDLLQSQPRHSRQNIP
ncbi:hypothetical protein E2P81_ATG02748 [Venturia nashicola]|nr:hypothetical protein E2P81_ATG02748 [Venturia nashicola]